MLRHRQCDKPACATALAPHSSLYLCVVRFGTQLYIILIRPERNVRQSMMPVRYSAINRTPGTGPSSMMAAIMVTAATCNQDERIERHVTPTSPQSPVGGGGGNGTVSSNGATPTSTAALQMPNGTTCRHRTGRNSLGKCFDVVCVVIGSFWLV